MSKPHTLSLERFLYLLTVAFALLGIGWLLHTLSAVLMPFLVALVLAFLMDPTVARIRRLVKNQVAAVLVTLTLLFGALIFLALIIVPQVMAEAAHFAGLVSAEWPHWQLEAQRTPWLRDALQQVTAADLQQVLTGDAILSMARNALPGFWQGVNSLFAWLLGLVGVLTMLVYLVFILIDEEDVKQNWERLIPFSYRAEVVLVIEDLQRVMNVFFRGQLKIALVLMLVYIIGFNLLGLPLAMVLGMLAGALSIVPYLSLLTFPLALLSGALLALDQHRTLWPILLLVLLVYVVAYALDGMLLTPRIQGRNTGLRPQYILLSLSVWGSLFGIPGMIIALPFTTVLVRLYARRVNSADANMVTGHAHRSTP